jgi:3-oxoacyl-[acyl-carrier protein] reductase
VTGGSYGVGREVVLELAARGYAVVVGYDDDQHAATSAVGEALAMGGTALAVRADVADELDVDRLFAETIEAFGGIDIVIHAAAPVVPEPEPVADDDLARFDAVLRTDVRGTFIVDRQAVHQLRDGGAIVNLSGTGLASPSDLAHAASRSAVEAMTRALAHRHRGRDITVNAVAPLAKGPAVVEAMVRVVTLLVGPDGRGLDGQVIRVDADTT